MVAYTKPQQKKKEESERPRREREHIKFIVHTSLHRMILLVLWAFIYGDIE